MSVKQTITPALEAFADAICGQIVFAQVRIHRAGDGFELRHVDDTHRDEGELEMVSPDELRRLTQFAPNGAFRPLKSAPNLRSGWRVMAAGAPELGRCLDSLYPGALADWFFTRNKVSGVTNYREFTNRQSGMYRITTMLEDRVAETMIRACCDRDFCLKRRLWTLDGSAPAPDLESEKSVIPCLEPCAILLEFARKVARLEQEEKRRPEVEPEAGTEPEKDSETGVVGNAGVPVAESDFDSPRNPRRARFDLEKTRWMGKEQ